MGRFPQLTAEEWDTISDPAVLFFRLPTGNPRKLRLLAVACCDRLGSLMIDDRSKAAVQVAEMFADGEATSEELQQAAELANDVWNEAAYDESEKWNDVTTDLADVACSCADQDATLAALSMAKLVRGIQERYSALTAETPAQSALARCIFGNPFRPVAFSLAWRSESATALARTAYDTRNFTLLPILADALEEAGCDNADILTHCRQPDAIHARGCWVVDLVRGKG